ncbi:MAG: threonine ammonia-lyase [Desulfobacterales bacterium]|jgi:threonine dehydratase|nr:threonine ammonia-lyase [Desulfobacterales bacterium]
MPITLNDIKRAAEILKGNINDTPCLFSVKLSAITGINVFLKYENLQFTGSFKERGALLKLESLSVKSRKKGVITMSAGNHAQAVAHRASQLGIPATIVMPRYTPNIKVERTRAFGAEVILHGEELSETAALAKKLVKDRRLIMLHPYDDEKIITGQGTIALEMLNQHPTLDVIIVPVGGGGLISGIAIAAREINPAIDIIGVETQRFPSMKQALAGEPIQCGRSTIAEGIAVKTPGVNTLPVIRRLVKDIVLVDEPEIESAVRMLLDLEKTVVEGAAAAAVAALVKTADRLSGRNVGVVLSGGNIDPLVLASIIKRGLVQSGRMVRLHVAVYDVPGALSKVCRCIGDAGANIVEVHHQRSFTSLPLQSADVEFILITRGRDHVDEIMSALSLDGFTARLMNVADINNPF